MLVVRRQRERERERRTETTQKGRSERTAFFFGSLMEVGHRFSFMLIFLVFKTFFDCLVLLICSLCFLPLMKMRHRQLPCLPRSIKEKRNKKPKPALFTMPDGFWFRHFLLFYMKYGMRLKQKNPPNETSKREALSIQRLLFSLKFPSQSQ